jgi:ABC-2 type transport system ATP-binding protein
MKSKALEIHEIVKKLSWIEVLHKVSLEVLEWEIYGFLGPNGAWKTTTMKCIMGLISQDSWNITILWEDWLTLETKKKIGFMPENTYLYKYLTWREFLKFNGKFFWLEWDILEDKVGFLLKRVWLEDAWDKYLQKYSKWMLQRVWLAQSIINDPKLLFLDEPMSGLDPIGRKMVKDLLVELQETWTTIFFNTHILADVESICDKFSIIHKGSIIIQNKDIKTLDKWLEDFFIDEISKNS